MCVSNAVDRTDDDVLWNGTEGDGNVRSEREMKALTVKMETVALFGKGMQNLRYSLYIKCIKLVVKYYFLADISFLGGSSSVWINIFSLCRHVLFEGCLRLESCIRINTVW